MPQHAPPPHVRQRPHAFAYSPESVSTIAYTTDMARGAIGWTPYKDPPNDFRVKLRKQGYVLDDVGPLDWCQFHDSPTPVASMPR